MTILELANKLKAIYDKHGNVEVMFRDPNGRYDEIFEAGMATFEVAEEGDFPDDYDMPAGFQFVLISN